MQARLHGKQSLTQQDLSARIARAERAYKAAVEASYLSASGSHGLRGAFVVFESRAVAEQVLARSPSSAPLLLPCCCAAAIVLGMEPSSKILMAQ